MVDQEHELMRPDEVATFLGLGRSKTYELIASREIPVVAIGRSVRVPRAALREWVRQRTESPVGRDA
ncbi:MAG: helix-turn-helix domain-containing protein [Chloroflexota bacterium]|nr:helix-turn-helix domain-containing protein [Chloroflexota bacterium]